MSSCDESGLPAARDLALAREIAEFIADRAFSFGHHECRAWALTSFGAWAALAGGEPTLALRPQSKDSPRDSQTK